MHIPVYENVKTFLHNNKSKIVSVASGVAVASQAVIASAGNTTLENTTEGITLAGTTTNTVLGVWSTPPLSYVLGFVLFSFVMGFIAGVIKGRRSKK